MTFRTSFLDLSEDEEWPELEPLSGAVEQEDGIAIQCTERCPFKRQPFNANIYKCIQTVG